MKKARPTDFPLFEDRPAPVIPPAIRQEIVESLGELLIQIVVAETKGGEDEAQA